MAALILPLISNKNVAVYDSTVGVIRRLLQSDVAKAGDPQRASEILVLVVKREHLPSHLLPGPFAVGKSILQSDEQLLAYQFESVPNYEHTLVWVNKTTPDLREEQRFDRYPDSIVPGHGGTSLHFVTFPPGSVFADPSFDGEAARTEALIRLRGLADHFEKDDPAMHETNTVDYAVVYEGEIWLELDDAKTIHLKRGDVVVQNGTRHAWRNKGTTPVTMLFFLNGAKE
jgi:mannose-6-phosphate isomerase-like protein (cupin superfamily)